MVGYPYIYKGFTESLSEIPVWATTNSTFSDFFEDMSNYLIKEIYVALLMLEFQHYNINTQEGFSKYI
jgi:hypothetical protein